MNEDNMFEQDSLINFAFLNACFNEYVNLSFEIYKKELKKNELTFEDIKHYFQEKNEENANLFLNQEC